MHSLQSQPSHTRIGGCRDIVLHQPSKRGNPPLGDAVEAQTHSVDHRRCTPVENNRISIRHQGVVVDKVSTKPPTTVDQHKPQPLQRNHRTTKTTTNVVTKTTSRRKSHHPLFGRCCVKSRSTNDAVKTTTTTKSYSRSRSRSQSTSSNEGGW